MSTRIVDGQKEYVSTWFKSLSGKAKYLYMWLYPQSDIAGFCSIDESKAEFYLGLKKDEFWKSVEELTKSNRIVVSIKKDSIWFIDYYIVQGFSDLNYKYSNRKGVINSIAKNYKDFENANILFDNIKIRNFKIEETDIKTIGDYINWLKSN